jgi:YD repeat-containing protein
MLRTIKTREGFTQDLFYEGGRLAKVVDLTDPFLVRTLTFEYDESNRIRKITDPAGGTYIYEYDSTNHLEFVTGPSGLKNLLSLVSTSMKMVFSPALSTRTAHASPPLATTKAGRNRPSLQAARTRLK